MPRPIPRAPSFFFVALAYVAGLAAAWAALRWCPPGLHPLWRVAVADLAATLAVFVFSVVFDNTSVYDPYWSVAPLAIAPYLATAPEAAPGSVARKVLVCALVGLWGLRLTYNWARSFGGLGHEDWRYVDIRRKTGILYWPASLFGLQLMPTVLVYLGGLPLFPALSSPRPLGILDALAAVVTLGAIAIETVADEQLRAFRRTRKGSGEIMATGLWSVSRHPNYFGEVAFWWGVYLFGVAGDASAWWSVAGAASISVLFFFVSIPLLDKRSLAGRPAYAEHMKRVSALVPWFPRRGPG
jgi:steroid 5-alpha reductase family enzyme